MTTEDVLNLSNEEILEIYPLLAKRTLSLFETNKEFCAHMILGISTEFSEIKNATSELNRKEEIGDLLWFASVFYNVQFNSNLLKELNMSDAANIEVVLFETQNIFKKWIGYNKPFVKEKIDDLFSRLIGFFIQNLDVNKLCSILKNNIIKLLQRFPNNFSLENAINRDTQKEFEVMKKYFKD